VSFTKNIKTSLRNFDKYRRAKMKRLEVLLYWLLNNKKHNQQAILPNDQVKNIAIVRNNGRIGNMYFLIPFISQTRALYPNATITLVLKQSWQGHVFEGLEVDQIRYTNFSFKHLVSYIKEIRSLKQTVYDLVIVPTNSVEDSMICAMLSAKNKVSSPNDNRNICYTHTFDKSDDKKHAALTNLYLLEKLGNTLVDPISHHLAFTATELQFGEDKRLEFEREGEITLAYFRGARGSKQLSDEKWREIIAQFEQASPQPINWVEVLSPDIASPLQPSIHTVFQKDMRLLASVLKHMDGFICCDTGPLHLADAAGARCIGLYNKTNPEVFGVLSDHSISEHLSTLDASRALTRVLEK
jgi:ADP-heptose:LPS heptosyltransferase